MVKKQPRLCQDEVDHTSPKDLGKLPAYRPLAERLIQSQRGKGNQMRWNEEQQKEHIAGQRHRNNTVMQQIKPDIKGHRHGHPEDKCIQQHVDGI